MTSFLKPKVCFHLIAGCFFVTTASMASGKDLCASGELKLRNKNSSAEYFLSEFPQVVFTKNLDCDYTGACQYRILAYDVEKKRKIRDEIVIENICTAFSKSESTIQNSYKNSDINLILSRFSKLTNTSYVLKSEFGTLSLLVQTYHGGRDDTQWGVWEGDPGGGFLPLQVKYYEISTSWLK